jgi:serine/threonine protein kinase
LDFFSAVDLLKKLLQINSSERLSSAKALQHQWFKESLTIEEYKKIIDQPK